MLLIKRCEHQALTGFETHLSPLFPGSIACQPDASFLLQHLLVIELIIDGQHAGSRPNLRDHLLFLAKE